MKSLRILSLIALLSVCGQAVAELPVDASVVKTGFWKKSLESMKEKGGEAREWMGKTFTKEKALGLWTSMKDRTVSGFEKSIAIIKANPKTSGAIAVAVTALVAGSIVAYKKGWFGKAKAKVVGLFKNAGAKKETANMNGGNGNGGNSIQKDADKKAEDNRNARKMQMKKQ